MAFVDDLKDKATDVAQVAGKKMGEVYSITKLKVSIAEKKRVLRALYRELGEIAYENYKTDNDDMDEFSDKAAEISLVIEDIAELENKCKEFKNMVLCTSCNTYVDKNANFCPKCGAEKE